MILVKNKIIPFKGFKAMAIWPFIFYRGDKPSATTLNHEKIHFEQQKELLVVFFYILYFVFWIAFGYRNIPFEREAYLNDKKKSYLKNRKRFSWVNYLKLINK